MSEEYILQGYLQKLGDKGIVRGWKKRLFIVTQTEPTQIRYMKKENSEELGFIDLTKVISVTPNEKTDKDDWPFLVETPTRKYYLLANSEENLNYWIKGIEKVFIFIRNKSYFKNNLQYFNSFFLKSKMEDVIQ